MTAEFFRRYIDMLAETEDDMFAPRQHHLIAQVFDRLAQNQMEFAQEERKEYNDPEAGEGYENDASYRYVALAFRRGMQPGIEAWWYLDTMLTENSAEEVEDAVGVNLYDLKEQLKESDDDLFATRQFTKQPWHQISLVFDRLAQGKHQEATDSEYPDQVESDAREYKDVARAFRQGMAPGLAAWRLLDTLYREDAAGAVKADLDIDLYNPENPLNESDDDLFATRQHQQIAKVFNELAQGMLQAAQEYETEDGDDHGCESDANDYQEVAQAFKQGMAQGMDAWGGLDTELRENSAEVVENDLNIDLYDLQDAEEERYNQTLAGQAAATERARRDAEWEAEWKADAPARAANEVKMWVVKKGQTKPQLPQMEYDQREHPNFKKELAEFQKDAAVSWPNIPYEIKVTIGGKPVKV